MLSKVGCGRGRVRGKMGEGPRWNRVGKKQVGGWGDGEGMHNTWVFAEAQGRVRRSLRLLRGDASLGRMPGYVSGNQTELELELDGPYVIDGELFENRGPLRLSLSEPLRWLAL